MDKLDYLILAELLEDARTPFLTVAKKLGVSPYTVKQRYEDMKRKGLIRRTVVSIDLTKLGYQGKAFLLITTDPEKSKTETIAGLKRISNIISGSELIGPFDIIAIAPITDYESIRRLVNQVKALPGVQHVQITCINDTAFPLNASFGKIMSQKCRELATKHDPTSQRAKGGNRIREPAELASE
jgi:Lrp/AsnC family transcriptional regulator for asnA, asnC and gidA